MMKLVIFVLGVYQAENGLGCSAGYYRVDANWSESDGDKTPTGKAIERFKRDFPRDYQYIQALNISAIPEGIIVDI